MIHQKMTIYISKNEEARKKEKQARKDKADKADNEDIVMSQTHVLELEESEGEEDMRMLSLNRKFVS